MEWMEEEAEMFADYAESERPIPGEIPRMERSEYLALVSARSLLPRTLKGEALLQGDIDTLLASNIWNPAGRVLADHEKAELSKQLKRYRYYARLSPIERYKTLVEPRIAGLRDAGAYVEYPAKEAPPAVEGISVSHAEPSDQPGTMRLYYFHPEDYPEIDHQARVERERGLETFLDIYYRINGYPDNSSGE